MIKIEFEEPHILKCDCCDKDVIRLTRFVYKDGDAFAIYYAQFTPSHEDGMVKLLVGVGEWETEEEITMKYAFPLVLWQTEDNWNVQVVNASESPWNTEVIGKMLDRTIALENRFIKDVFHITDHIVLEDKEILGYFGK